MVKKSRCDLHPRFLLGAAEKSVLASWHIHQLLADLHVEFTGLAVTTFAIAALNFMDFPATPSSPSILLAATPPR